VIERELPETGRLTPPQPDAISQTSCGIPPDPGTADSVGTSYVADDKIDCLHIAPNAEIIREHAQCGEFSKSNRRSQVSDRSYEQKQNGVALKTPASGSEF